MFDFVRVACVTPKTFVCDTIKNCEEIKKKTDLATTENADIIVFPELCTTGASCGGLFFQKSLINGAKNVIKEVADYTKLSNAVIFMGSPLTIKEKLYNCGIVLFKGKILGISVKTYLTIEEKRFFCDVKSLKCKKINAYEIINGEDYEIPIGNNLIFDFKDKLKVAYEIGNDVKSPFSPGSYLSLKGAELIVNSGADIEIANAHEKRKELIKSTSDKNICAYAYVSSGSEESTTDCVFSGHKLICQNGKVLKENENLADSDSMIISDIDIEKTRIARNKDSIFKDTNINFDSEIISVNFEKDFNGDGKYNNVSKSPFIPSNNEEALKLCKDMFAIQVAGLKKRLSITKARAVIGVSGGLDSTLALLVCVQAMKELNRPLTDVTGITMPGFGTTDRTHDNSVLLMKNLGISYDEISIKNACEIHFKDIGHNIDNHDLTYENAQARERTQILMDYAGKVGGMVIGTGDLSELCLGWCTYNGDHMSMYGVNSGITKTLIKKVVEYIALSDIFPGCSEILKDILNTPISPELLPPKEDGKIKQKTEDIVGPYELHDFFIYYVLKYGFSPSKIYFLAKIAFKNIYDDETILKWLKNFYKRFFSQQFKRSCSPDGIKVTEISISPRGGLNIPSDACADIWLKEVENISL